VLPFANLSADKENEYFSDGQDIRRIAAALDVRTVLEGSVRRAGNRIRVSAQLINAADGYHLWSERFTGNWRMSSSCRTRSPPRSIRRSS
jgi:adenylate cyclase